MNLRELLNKGFAVLLVRSLGAALSFLMILLFARWLGADLFGSFFFGLTIVTILAVLARLGLDQVVLKQVAAHKTNDMPLAAGYLNGAISLIWKLGLIFTVLMLLFAEFFAAGLFESDAIAYSLFYLGLSIVPMALIFLLGEAFKSFSKPVLAGFFQVVLAPALTLLVSSYYYFVGKFSLDVAVQTTLFGFVLSIVLMLWMKRNIVHGISASKIKMSSLVSQGMPMLLATSGALILSWSDVVILGLFASEADVGIYSAASRTVLVTMLVLVAINSITAPKYAQFYKDGELDKLANLAQKSSAILFLSMVFPGIVFLFFPSWVMSWFGSEFLVGSSVLVILAIGQIVNVSCGSVGYLLTMTGREKRFQAIMLSSALINIVLSIIFLNVFGVIGVAYSTALSIIVWNVWAMYEVKQHLGFWTLSFAFIKNINKWGLYQ